MGAAVLNRRPLRPGIRALGPYGEAPVLDLWVAARPTDPPAPPRTVAPARTMRRAARFLTWLLAGFAALQVLDLTSTLLLMSIGGTEVNPVSAWLLQQGVGTFVAVKLTAAAVLLACIPLVRRSRPAPGMRTATWTCAGFDTLYVVTVLSNFVQFAVFA